MLAAGAPLQPRRDSRDAEPAVAMTSPVTPFNAPVIASVTVLVSALGVLGGRAEVLLNSQGMFRGERSRKHIVCSFVVVVQICVKIL